MGGKEGGKEGGREGEGRTKLGEVGAEGTEFLDERLQNPKEETPTLLL